MSASVFVMSDVVGSTALWEAHGDDMRSSLVVHDQIIHTAMHVAGGRVFKHTGDGMIAVFDAADAAADAALAAVDGLADVDWGPTGPSRSEFPSTPARSHRGATTSSDRR